MPKGSWGRLIRPGLGGPKPNPKGIGDGEPVNIPAPLRRVDQGGTPQAEPSGVTDCPVQPVRHPRVGKSARGPSRAGMRSRYGGEGRRVSGREKPLGSAAETVPHSDTGRQVEDTQVGERTLVKELGKMSPYVRKKGSPERSGPQRAGPGDCLVKTQHPANPKGDV